MKIIETQLTEKEFINACMVILFKKPIAWLAPVLGIFLMLSTFTQPNQSFNSPMIYLAPLLYLIIFSGMLPLITYLRAKKVFNAPNSRVKEKIVYEFQDTQLSIRGESFTTQFSWDKIPKVTTTKNWIFVWQNSLYANAIPKKDVWDGELLKLREILDVNKVKHNFK